MISEPKLKTYRNSEFIAFMNDTLGLLTRANIAALSSPQADLQTAYDGLETSFKVSQGSLLTASIQELDARRDAAIRGIHQAAKAYSFHYEEATQVAAIAVAKAISKYGTRIAQLNYQAQTATLKSLIKDFENDADLTAALTTLNLSTWVAELKAANIAFEEKYLDRVTDKANKKVAPVSEQRPAAMTAYATVVQHIQANQILNPSAALTELVGQLNELVVKYNAL
ncbi:MAG: DUF6261 family protein [Saprospiraceae bacterium]